MAQGSRVVRFSPFRKEDLGTTWKITFGNWQVADGKLHQVRHAKDLADADVDLVIGGGSPKATIKQVGEIAYNIDGGGADTVRLTFDFSLSISDSFVVTLDEWGVVWRLEHGMRGLLVNSHAGSVGHEYDDQVLSPTEPKKVNSLEVLGQMNKVTFILNGKELFSTTRPFQRPFRQITIRTRSGIQISDMTIETQRLHPAWTPAKQTDKPILAACVDFGDDMLYAPFTAEMIDLMVERLKEIGIQRIYWLHSIRIRPEALGPNADPQVKKALEEWNAMVDEPDELDPRHNFARTCHNCYPFLPKVCQAAHKRGMEVYAMLKSIDQGRHPSRGLPSPFVNDHFQNTHPEAMMRRWSGDQSGAGPDEPIRTIKLYKDNDKEHNLKPHQLSVWQSDDNQTYSRVKDVKITMGKEVKQFPRHWQGGLDEPREVQVITIAGLDIRSKHFAVTSADQGDYSFRNRLYRLAEILDEKGRQIPVTRNVSGAPKAQKDIWDGKDSFAFEDIVGFGPTGQWFNRDAIEMFHAIDGQDLGIAFRRGYIDPVRGTPSPAHPASHQYWLDWIAETLEAGVDGIDMRIVHHRNILDWANYGFGPLVEDAFKKKYGRELKPQESCRKDHMDLLGEFYTEFLRKGSKMTHDAGKKFVHHVSFSMGSAPDTLSMTNIRWDWRKWMEEGIVDTITLKNMVPGTAFCQEVLNVAQATGTETMACPYLNLIFTMSDSWQDQLSDMIADVKNAGIDGMILYETASFMQATADGDIVMKFPELAKVLSS